MRTLPPVLCIMAVKMQVSPTLFVLPAIIAATYGFMLRVGTPPQMHSFLYRPYTTKTYAGCRLHSKYPILRNAGIFLPGF